MKKILVILLLCCCGILSAQCPDFTDLTAAGVTCHYGVFDNPLQYTGIAVDRHTVISQQGADPNTGYQLPFLPPGESAVVRLGNPQVGAQAEAVSYQFTVNPDFAILLLKFAVVLEEPGHPSIAQPRFVVRVLNSAGELVEACAEYDVTAAGNIPGFQTYTTGLHNICWRPWTNVGIDLSDYAGQTVNVQFATYDCDYWGHFGYAYYTASCINNKLSLEECVNNQVTLVAPAGFESYAWDNGSADPSASYTVNGTTTANCLITSATGCTFTLSGTIFASTSIPPMDSVVYDTICEGDVYTGHFFNLPPQWETGTHTFRNTYVNAAECSGGDITTTLYLTVLPRFFHIYDAVCQGDDYHAHGFHYTNLQTGSYTDSITFTRPDGCDSVSVLHLVVSPSFTLSNIVDGPLTLCNHDVCTYTLQNAEGLATFFWDVPAGASILYGQGTASASVYFTDNAPNPATVTLTGANGCGSGSVPITVTHWPAYHSFFQDSLCSGNDYHRYGFDLARQDSVGWTTFTKHYSTAHGCDSVCILQLLVTATPTLTTLAQPSEFCVGQDANVYALGENAFLTQGFFAPSVAIGDILCSDGSVVKPANYNPAQNTPMGIVFYVDNTGQHGWAVHLHDNASNVLWNPVGQDTDIVELNNYYSSRDAIMDLNGHANTQAIRAVGDATHFPAAYAVDFANGWYLPAVGQLRLLFAEVVTLNASLQLVGGTQFPINGYWFYWSSTEYDQEYGWDITYDGAVRKSKKDYSNESVRSVRNF